MNSFNPVHIKTYNAYQCNLNFNPETLAKIISQIYELENDPEKKYHSAGRTFKINKGFHSCNILDKKYGILEKYDELRIMVSRVQELLYNHFSTEDITFTKVKYGCLKINELWINILRKTYYNMPHNHSNHDISGNFYLKLNKNKNLDSDGALSFIHYDTVHFYLPKDVEKNNSPMIIPTENLGIIFRSHLKHVVLPHFSDEDRIGVAFNAVFDVNYTYDKIYPTPYWLPIKYNYLIKEGDVDMDPINGNKITIQLKNKLSITIPLDKTKTKEEDFVNTLLTLTEDNLKPLINQYAIDVTTYFNVKEDKIETKNSLKDDTSDESFKHIKNNTNTKQIDDYFYTENPKWTDTDHYYYEDNHSDKLIIIFSGMGGDKQPPTFIFHKFLSQYKCDKLFLRDLNYSWFLNNPNFGNSHGTENIKNLLEFIKTYIKPRHENTYTIGCSAGGFACILYGHLLNVTKCLSFAPQTVIHPKKETLFGDTRWKSQSELIKHIINENYLDLKTFVPFNMQTVLYCSNEKDRKHCDYILHDMCNIIYKDYNESHLTALEMKKDGSLKNMFDNLINPY